LFRHGPQASPSSTPVPQIARKWSATVTPSSSSATAQVRSSTITTMPRRNQAEEGEGSSNIRYNIIDGKALDPLHFSPEIVNMLNFQGLLDVFLRIENVVYPNLVNQFY
ncbi:hypothetical protein, partial [Escherichia coli]|uniref:hypothetical protein n=1 Tax=Escherichia coli TaxID=562 RepID=UPI0032DA7119